MPASDTVGMPSSKTCERSPRSGSTSDLDHQSSRRAGSASLSVASVYLGAAARFSVDVLNVAEIGADNRIVASVVFDLDDIDAAFAELDARYLAGEAAEHEHTWSVVAERLCRTQSP